MANYHSGIVEGKVDRKKEFLNNHGGWQSVKNKIDSWTPEDLQLSHAVRVKQMLKLLKRHLRTI